MFMKAILWKKYGSPEVLKIGEVAKPVPKDNEVLIKVYATTVTAGDCELRGLKFSFFFKLVIRVFFGFFKPRNKILGQELSGVIESVGKDVTQFKEGDKIFAATGLSLASYAEYKCMSEKSIALMPSNMTYGEATAVPVGGLEALNLLRKGNIRKGAKVLINGAGGSIGTIAIQLAKYYEAEVTAVDSELKLDMLKSIGADYVIDYSKEDFTDNTDTYDIIVDIVGKSNFSNSIEALKEHGSYVISNANSSHRKGKRKLKNKSSKKVIVEANGQSTEDLKFLKNLIEQGKLKTVIDKTFSLDQIVEAHRYVESGKKKGNLIIEVNQ